MYFNVMEQHEVVELNKSQSCYFKTADLRLEGVSLPSGATTLNMQPEMQRTGLD